MNFVQVLNGIALGSLFMILSSGLAMIYGLRGVGNFAHGALYMAGAYIAYSVSTYISFWAALIAAPLALAVIGVVIELVFFRPLQKRDHIQVALITFGLAMVIERTIVLIWGADPLRVAPPDAFGGTISVLGASFPTYRLVLIGAALLIALGLVIWLRWTRVGLEIRAASHDGTTAVILGVNVDRVSLIVVCVGAALAGLAGALAGPYTSVYPSMGSAILISVLIVVVIGGIGSIAGAMIAGMGLGIVQTLGTVYVPDVAALVPYVAIVAVLLWRPMGLAGKRV